MRSSDWISNVTRIYLYINTFLDLNDYCMMVSSAVWSGYIGAVSTVGCSFITAHTEALNCSYAREYQYISVARQFNGVRVSRPAPFSSLGISTASTESRQEPHLGGVFPRPTIVLLVDMLSNGPDKWLASFTFCASFAYCHRTSDSNSVRPGWPSYGFASKIELLDNDEAIPARNS